MKSILALIIALLTTISIFAQNCQTNPGDLLCVGWVEEYINNNYVCGENICGAANVYLSPQGQCVVDFVQEIHCFLTVCPMHEIYDMDGNFIISYSSECGLEGLGYSARQSIWSCGQNVCTQVHALMRTDGDVFIENINKGVIMKSPNGQCWRYAPDNNGQLIPTVIVCPN